MSLCPQTGRRLCLHLPGGVAGPAPRGLGLHGSLFPGQPLLPAHPFPSGGTTTQGPSDTIRVLRPGSVSRVRSEVSLRCNLAWALEQTLPRAQDLPSPPAQDPGGGARPARGLSLRRWEPHMQPPPGLHSRMSFRGVCFRGVCFSGITLMRPLEPEAGLETRCSQRAVPGSLTRSPYFPPAG